ncbi:MAG: hypothetical protein SGPRY_000587 [Prymnesium sp.]
MKEVASVLRSALRHRRGGERSEFGAYVNGTTFLKKVKAETAGLSSCLKRQADWGRGERAGWEVCTTLACNWAECVVGGGLYAAQIEGWLSIFPLERFLFLEAGQMRAKPTETVARLLRFTGGGGGVGRGVGGVGVDGMARELARVDNNSAGAGGGEVARRLLARFYAPHNSALLRLLGESAPQAPWLH